MSSQKNSRKSESGSILVSVLILMAVAAVIVSSALSSSAANSRSMYEAENRVIEYYRSEESLSKAVTWLRTNSTDLVSVFSRSNFYSTFDRTSPTIGANDTAIFTVPTKIKMQGTNNSVILTTSNAIATGAYPSTTNPLTGATFNALTTFSSASLGSDPVRLTLVDAIAIDSTKDYGDTDAGSATPETDFYPVYRVDSMKAVDRGAHTFGYVVGNLVSDAGYGFYGQNLVTMNQDCDSYVSNNGAYSSTSKKANCAVGSNGTVQIQQSNEVYGTAKTNGSINNSNPYGGKVCADFTNNCPTPGTTCAGATCGVASLPTFQTWATYCPSNQGDLSVSSNTTLTVAGNASNQKCWNSVTVATNTTLTLSTTAYAYYIDTLTFQNNSNSQLNIAPSPASGTVTLYVRTITGDSVNGNQIFNSNNKPYQFRINYLGTNALTINGNSQVKAFVTAPYAAVSFSGSNEFYGGIKALSLSTSGSAGLHYDESGDIPVLSDSEYTIRSLEERYR